MKKLTILVDLDGICTNFVEALIDMYNTYEAEDGKEAQMDACVSPELKHWTPMGDKLWNYVNAPGFYEHLSPLPGAISSLEKLHGAGHDVTILTSPGKGAIAAAEKIRWIHRHLPFLNYHDVVITPKKWLCRGDVVIDDSADKVEKIRKAWPSALILGIEWPYNREQRSMWDALSPSWKDPAAAWLDMLHQIEDRTHRG